MIDPMDEGPTEEWESDVARAQHAAALAVRPDAPASDGLARLAFAARLRLLHACTPPRPPVVAPASPLRGALGVAQPRLAGAQPRRVAAQVDTAPMRWRPDPLSVACWTLFGLLLLIGGVVVRALIVAVVALA